MPITRLNHAVLYVRNAEQSAKFYQDVLGFRRLPVSFSGAVFMQAAGSTNDHDLGLFSIGESARPSPAGRGGAVGLYHLAWEVDTLNELERLASKLTEVGALVGASDHGSTKAIYAQDPDGIEFEVSWLVPAELLDDATKNPTDPRPRALDIAKEKERYGATTRGGVGVSVPG